MANRDTKKKHSERSDSSMGSNLAEEETPG